MYHWKGKSGARGTCQNGHQMSFVRNVLIHPIHAAAMFNRMRGLEGKYAQHYVNRDVT